MISPYQVAAVLVTRGNVDLSAIMGTLGGFGKVAVWDNSRYLNMGPFGQFLMASLLNNFEVVYFQDDDCTTDPAAIVAAWEPGKVVCNMGTQGHRANYEDRLDKLMGFGSCFEKAMIRPTFERYAKTYPIDRVLWREPGRIFTAMNHEKTKMVEVPFQNLPWAEGPDRLYRQPDHLEMRDEAIRRVKKVLEC
jgi:hypothetical protein